MPTLPRLLVTLAIALLVQAAPLQTYRDRGGRFTFTYPSTFGTTSPGTDDGFADRVAAVRFSAFPAAFGGEVVVTKGFPLIDLQAVGGLYDSLTLQVFTEPLRTAVVTHLQPLTAANFCALLGQPTHLDPSLPAFRSLPQPQRQAIAQVDLMRNANPQVIECRASGDVVTFDKTRAFTPGAPVQHVYGAVRFLTGPWSTVQLIAGGDAPAPGLRASIGALVASFQAR